MKRIKILAISLLAFLVLYFAFYKSGEISMHGDYQAQKIILSGQQQYPNRVDSLLGFPTQININDWTRTLSIYQGRETIKAQFVITKNSNGCPKIRLSSQEKTLNGLFNLTIDTLHPDPMQLKIRVKIQSAKTILLFQRDVYIKPWKPELPRKGQV